MASLKDFMSSNRYLPNGGGSYTSVVPKTGGVTTPAFIAPTPTASSLFTPVTTPVVVPPKVQPTVFSPAPSSTPSPVENSNLVDVPKQYINPATGQLYSAKEIVANMAKNMPQSKNMGDVPTYAGDAITKTDQSVNDMTSIARNLNNARNDIATGQTDPYDITQGGKIVYSPTERAAIEKAYAGIYDPALNDVFARLKDKKAEEDAKAKREEQIFNTNESIRQWKATTGSKAAATDELLTVNDAQSLGVPYGTTKNQAASMGLTPSDLTAATKTMVESAPTVKMFANKISQEINDAKNGLGPMASRWREFAAGKIGLEDKAFTQLRTNISLLTTSLLKMHVGARGGDTMMAHFKELVDIGKQSPENLLAAISEISDYADFIAAKGDKGGTSSGVLRSPDGTQEVSISDLTQSELTEAKNAGWK